MADLLAALKRASRELERYVDLQQTLNYIEYAADTQKELDAINAVIAEAESAVEPTVTIVAPGNLPPPTEIPRVYSEPSPKPSFVRISMERKFKEWSDKLQELYKLSGQHPEHSEKIQAQARILHDVLMDFRIAFPPGSEERTDKPTEDRIREILDGIDKTETEHKDGWWETSVGAEFGAEKLAEVLAAVRTAIVDEPGGDEVADASFLSTVYNLYLDDGRPATNTIERLNAIGKRLLRATRTGNDRNS